MPIDGIVADALRQLIQRIERLEEEKAAIAADIKDVYAQAKSQGFDTKTMRKIVGLRKLGQSERDEQEALLDIYKAALGMLNGTPLGDAAVRRLRGRQQKKPTSPQMDQEEFIENDAAQAAAPPVPEEEKRQIDRSTVDDARTMGAVAHADGKPVTDNPFPARDARRAAWDEAWCKAAGSDGMEIPEAWRRSKKPKADDEKKDAA